MSHSIFMGEIGDLPPKGFQSVRISLDLRGSLKWSNEKKWAEKLMKEGFSIVWDFEHDLHLNPFLDDSHLNAIILAIEHFNEALYCQEKTAGIILHRGAFFEELHLLLASLPEEVTPFLLLEEVNQKDLPWLMHLEHFKIAAKKGITRKFPFALETYGWEHGATLHGYFSKELFQPLTTPRIVVGVLDLDLEFNDLPFPFKLISEEQLTKEWDNLDYLIIPPILSSQGKRKVAGFQAAGGIVISTGKELENLIVD